MTRRPAVTLIEVLMAMFIMAIGMMALLVLFPLGALSMAQALKDDRCASAASMAENVAIAMNLRHDSSVETGFTTSTNGTVYVDPYGATQGYSTLGGVIPRVSPSFVGGSQPLADRWFSLPDDITFLENGTADIFTGGGPIDRGRRYSYAYLLTRPTQPAMDDMINLTVVVYSGRPVGSLAIESTRPVPPAQVISVNGFILSAPTLPIKRGGWVLDPVNGHFYRVTNLTTDVSGNMTVEVQPNLIGYPTVVPSAITVMENVAEVFDKGTSWLP